jgi:aminoglycoside phosphotransferase (APT) family kinase protein
MNISNSQIDQILEANDIEGPWTRYQTTGIANWIFMTKDVVLRIAADHPDSLCDSRTESVAAPVAREAGICTPKLLKYDDSLSIINKPFSLWERVYGEPLGSFDFLDETYNSTWIEIGSEVAKLHSLVTKCKDPNHYLDVPVRRMEIDQKVVNLEEKGYISKSTANRINEIIDKLRPYTELPYTSRFLHNDLHEMNILCSSNGRYLSLIDWGDAGWGDPTLEFQMIPIKVLDSVIVGYNLHANEKIENEHRMKIIWDKLYRDLRKRLRDEICSLSVDEYEGYIKKIENG